MCDENCLQKIVLREEAQNSVDLNSISELDMENHDDSGKAMKTNLIGDSSRNNSGGAAASASERLSPDQILEG
jgi:hypothetical protein